MFLHCSTGEEHEQDKGQRIGGARIGVTPATATEEPATDEQQDKAKADEPRQSDREQWRGRVSDRLTSINTKMRCRNQSRSERKNRRNEKRGQRAHSPVMEFADIPATSVSAEPIQRIFPMRSLSGQDEGAIVHCEIFLRWRLGGGPPRYLQPSSAYANRPYFKQNKAFQPMEIKYRTLKNYFLFLFFFPFLPPSRKKEKRRLDTCQGSLLLQVRSSEAS